MQTASETQEYGYIITCIVVFWAGFFINKLWMCLKQKSLTPSGICNRFFGFSVINTPVEPEMISRKVSIETLIECQAHELPSILLELQSDIGWVEGVEKVEIVEMRQEGGGSLDYYSPKI